MRTYKFENAYILDAYTLVGPLEHHGPLGLYYDYAIDDYYFGCKTFEEAEMKMMYTSIAKILEQNKIKKSDIDLFFAGDLNNQLAISSFNAMSFKFPYLGIYNACSTATEGLLLSALLTDSNRFEKIMVSSTSHNKVANKQFRYPNEYGGQKRLTQTTTVTGAFSVIVTNQETNIKISSATVGKVISYGIKDVNDMGSAMAPACKDTLITHLKELNLMPSHYDMIITGDLSAVGTQMFEHLLYEEEKVTLANHVDTGLMIFDVNKQDVQSGGSGPSCIGVVSFSMILKKLREAKLNKVLLIATGALFNPTSIAQKREIPCIAHAISLERVL